MRRRLDGGQGRLSPEKKCRTDGQEVKSMEGFAQGIIGTGTTRHMPQHSQHPTPALKQL